MISNKNYHATFRFKLQADAWEFFCILIEADIEATQNALVGSERPEVSVTMTSREAFTSAIHLQEAFDSASGFTVDAIYDTEAK